MNKQVILFNMPDNFEALDISGDAGIRVFGKNLGELFANAALGMYSLVTDIEDLREIKGIEISCDSSSLDRLLITWLNELIFRFDTYGFIGKKIIVSSFSPDMNNVSDEVPCAIKASVRGEEFDPERHARKLLVKAATYHKLKIAKSGDLWESEIIFDI